MSVYDDQKTESEAEQLRRITGIGPDEEHAMEERAATSDAPSGTKGGDTTNTYSPSGNGSAASNLLKAESNPTTDLSSSGVSSDVNPSFRDRARGALKSRKAKWAIGGGGAVAGLGIAGVFFLGNLFPVLRINNTVETLQNHFYASSEDAADKSANLLLRTYIVKKVMPGMVTNKCTSTKVNKSCAAPSDATNPIGALFSTWKDAKLEYKLYERYGIEIERQGNKFYFRSNNLDGRIPLGEYSANNMKDFNNRAFTQLNRTDIRKEMRRGLQDETLYKRMKYRFLVGPLLERKYNIRRCLLACAARDRTSDTIDAKKQAFKSWLNERVVAPRSEMYSLALDCALSSFDCVNGDEIDDGGEHSSKFERDLRVRLAEYKLRFGTESLNKLYESSGEFRAKGATEFFVGKLLGETTTKLGLKFIPVVGWVDMGARIIDAGKNAGPALKKLTYVTLAQTAVSTYYTMFRVPADELKAGKADVTEIGSFSQALDASPTADQGGMAGEDAPVFDAINGSGQNTLAAALLPRAAAAVPVGPYKCNDGQPLDATEVACPEEKVGAESWVGTAANYGSALANSPMYKVGGFAADFWLATIGKIFDLVGKGISWFSEKLIDQLVPQAFKDKISEISKALIGTFVGWIIPSPLTDNTSGARFVQIAAIGADISANDFVHYGMGGHALSDAETLAIREDQLNQQEADFSSKSLFARMFGTDSPRSFVSQVALSTPHNFTQFSTSFASAFSNPLRTVGNSFAALLPHKSAQAAVIQNPFGVTQYGWTDKDIDAVGFADDYWNANCSDLAVFNKAWGEKAVENTDTGMFDNDTTNPCLMLQAGVGMTGGRYNEKLLPSTTAASAIPAIPTTPAGPIDQKTLFQDSSNVKCADGTNDLGIQDGYSKGTRIPIRVCAIPGFKSTGGESNGAYGVPSAGGNVVVNSRVSGNFLALFQAAAKDGVKMNAVSSFRSMSHQLALCSANYLCENGTFTLVARPGYSNHQLGIAVDFAEPSSSNSSAQNCTTRVRDSSSAQWKWLNTNAAKFGIKQYSAESWHWDAMVAGNRCGGDGS